MRAQVDAGLYEQHGECVAAAPDVFWFAEDGTIPWLEHPPAELHGDAAYGAAVCPVMARRRRGLTWDAALTTAGGTGARPRSGDTPFASRCIMPSSCRDPGYPGR